MTKNLNTTFQAVKNTATIDWSEFLGDDISNDTTYHFTVDPLAYLVKWSKSNFKLVAPYGSPGELLMNIERYKKQMPDLFLIDPEHAIEAEQIRNYYTAKITTLGLRGESISKFRKRMYAVVTNNRSFDRSEIGILYRLIDFYREDQFMDSILENSTSVASNIFPKTLCDEFEYIGNVNRITKSVKQKRFWFCNNRGQLATFYVDSVAASAVPVLEQYLIPKKRYRIQDPVANLICLVGQDPNFFAYYLGKNYTIEECKSNSV
jgi:hypothetical protein